MYRKVAGWSGLLFAVLLSITACQPVQRVSAAQADAPRNANQAVVERFYDEVVNQKHMEMIPQIFDEKMVGHELGKVVPFVSDQELFAAFPDLKLTEDRWVIDGDLLTTQVTVSGTHTGAPLAGVPAKGEPVTWSQIDIWEVKNGKISQVWHNFAVADILQQIGYTFVPPAN